MNCFFRQNRNASKQALILYIDEYKNLKKNFRKKLFANFSECLNFRKTLENRFGFEVEILKNSHVEKHQIQKYFESEISENCNYLLIVLSLDVFLHSSLPCYIKCYTFEDSSRYLENFMMSLFHRFNFPKDCQCLFITNHCKMNICLEYFISLNRITNVIAINEKSYSFGKIVTPEFQKREFYLEDCFEFVRKQFASSKCYMSPKLKKLVFIKRAKLFNVPAVPPNQKRKTFLFHEEKLNNLVYELTQNNHKVLILIKGLLGSGTTFLAKHICHREEIRSFFVDGIYWLDFEGGPRNELEIRILQKKLLRLMSCRKEVNINSPEFGLKFLKSFIHSNYYRNILVIFDHVGDYFHNLKYLDVSLKSEVKSVKIIVTSEFSNEEIIPFKSAVSLKTPLPEFFKIYFKKKFRNQKHIEYRYEVLKYFQSDIKTFLLYINGVMFSSKEENSMKERNNITNFMNFPSTENLLKTSVSLLSVGKDLNIDDFFSIHENENKNSLELEEELEGKNVENVMDTRNMSSSKRALSSKRKKSEIIQLIMKEMSPSLRINFQKLVVFPSYRIPVKLVSVLWDSSSINECMYYLKLLQKRHLVQFYGKDELYVHPIISNSLKICIPKSQIFEFSSEYLKRLSFLCRHSGSDDFEENNFDGESKNESFTERMNWHEIQIKEFSKVEGSKERVLDYYFTHLFFHLFKTKAFLTMENTLLHYGWIEKKLEITGDINLVLQDYSYLSKNLKAFQIVFQVLRYTQLTKHVRTSLSSQIMSALRNYDHIELIRKYIENILSSEIKKGKNFLFPYLKNFTGVNLFKSSIVFKLLENSTIGPIVFIKYSTIIVYATIENEIIQFDYSKETELKRDKALRNQNDRISCLCLSSKKFSRILLFGTYFGLVKGTLMDDYKTSFVLKPLTLEGFEGGEYCINELVLFKNDDELLCSTSNKLVIIYSLKLKRAIYYVDFKNLTLESAYSALVSPNEMYFITISRTYCRIFSMDTKEVLRMFKFLSSCYCIDKIFEYIYCGGYDGTIEKYDFHLGKKLVKFENPIDSVITCLVLSNDGNYLFSGSDRQIRMYETGTGTEICKFLGHKGTVLDLKVSKDSNCLISVSQDNSIIFWDIHQHLMNMSQGEIEIIDNHAGEISDISIDIQKGLVWSCAKIETEVKVWNLDDGLLRQKLYLEDVGAIKCFGKHYFAVYFPSSSKLSVYDKYSFQVLLECKNFRSDIRMLIIVDGDEILQERPKIRSRNKSTNAREKCTRLFQSFYELRKGVNFGGHVVCFSKFICYSYDIEQDCFRFGCEHQYTITCAHGFKEFLLTGTVENIVRLWNFVTGHLVKLINLDVSPSSVLISKSKKRVFIGKEDGGIDVYDILAFEEDTKYCKKVKSFEGHKEPVISIRTGKNCFFSCGGSRLRTWSWSEKDDSMHEIVEHIIKEKFSSLQVERCDKYDIIVAGCDDGSLVFLKHLLSCKTTLSLLKRSKSQSDLNILPSSKGNVQE